MNHYCTFHEQPCTHNAHNAHQPAPGLWIEEQCWPDMWPGASLPLGAACVEIVAIVPLPPRHPAPAILLILPRHARCPDQAINTRVTLVTCPPVTLFRTIMSVFEYTEHCYESKEEERINSIQKWASAHSLVQYEFVKYLSTTVFLEQTDHFIQSNSQLEAECHNKL